MVTDPDFRPEDRLQFEALTRAARGAVEGACVVARRPGGFTVRHEASPQADRSFAYALIR